MDSERRKTLVALVREIDDLEHRLKVANEKLDGFLGNGNVHGHSTKAADDSENGVNPPNKKLIDFVASHPVVDYAEAARLIYGQDSKQYRDNVQAKLYYLKRQGWLAKGDGRNEWEVVQAKLSD